MIGDMRTLAFNALPRAMEQLELCRDMLGDRPGERRPLADTERTRRRQARKQARRSKRRNRR